MNRTRTEKGFTLIELLVVIAIIAILAIAIVVAYNKAKEAVRDSKRTEICREVFTAAQLYNNIKGEYPGQDSSSVVQKLFNDEGLLGSDPGDSGLSPNTSVTSWRNTTFADGGGDDFYARVENSGKDFCCTEKGCKNVDNYTDCGLSD
jgi:prepilin-type N-terminal cleavage/methylation domain-containing protein